MGPCTDAEHGQERHPLRAEYSLVIQEVAADEGADESVDVVNSLTMVDPLLPRAHTRASLICGRRGAKRAREGAEKAMHGGARGGRRRRGL